MSYFVSTTWNVFFISTIFNLPSQSYSSVVPKSILQFALNSQNTRMTYAPLPLSKWRGAKEFLTSIVARTSANHKRWKNHRNHERLSLKNIHKTVGTLSERKTSSQFKVLVWSLLTGVRHCLTAVWVKSSFWESKSIWAEKVEQFIWGWLISYSIVDKFCRFLWWIFYHQDLEDKGSLLTLYLIVLYLQWSDLK